jgi:Bacterial Ig domain
LTTTLTGTTSPAVTDLGGTVFGVALRLAGQRVSFTSPGPSPAVVGGSYRPRASASSKLPVGFSIDPASAKDACSLTASGMLKFTGAGACVLDATQAGSSYWAAAAVKRNFQVLGGKPVAEAATYSTPLGHALRVAAGKGILAKDTVNGSTIASHTSPVHGTLTLLGNGAFTYVPRPSFSGTDHFSYTLRNSLGRSTATIRVEVGLITRRSAQEMRR